MSEEQAAAVVENNAPATENNAPADENKAPAPEATTTGDPAPAPKSVLEGDTPAPAKPQTYPDDWRGLMVKSAGFAEGEEYDKQMKRAERFSDPGAVLKSYIELEKTVAEKSNDWRPQLPDDPTDDQVAAYRDALGVPQEAEGYYAAMPEGQVLSEEDKEVADQWFEHAHKTNMDTKSAIEGINFYNNLKEAQEIAIADLNAEMKEKSEDAMQQEFGAGYRNQINKIKAYLNAEYPADVRDALAGAKMQDGTMLMNHLPTLMEFARKATDKHPSGALIGGEMITDMQSIDEEIKTHKETHKFGQKEWYKNQPAQDRLKQLYDLKAQHS